MTDLAGFYLTRIQEHFGRSLDLARRRGVDLGPALQGPDRLPFLDDPPAPTAGAAVEAASLVEALLAERFEEIGWPNYRVDLARYEAARFAVAVGREAAPEPEWSAQEPAGPPARSAVARTICLQFDIPALCVRLSVLDEADPIPYALPRTPTRLLVSASPDGRLHTVRFSDSLEEFWEAVDGRRDPDQIAGALRIERGAVRAALKGLAGLGALVRADQSS